MWEVAPFTGAWIEIRIRQTRWSKAAVAPFTGAWIEIIALIISSINTMSLPSRERGLK